MGRNTIVAEKDISPGEEIFIAYADDIYEQLTAKQRRTLTLRNYGFACDCIACRPTEYRCLSDMRRQLISCLCAAKEGFEPPDYGKLEDIDSDEMWRVWPPSKQPLAKPITAAQNIEFTFLLARLREAEGTSGFRVAETYTKAAEQLLDHINSSGNLPQMDDIVPLASGRCVRDWMLKALAIFEPVCPPNSRDLEIMRYNWTNMSRMQFVQFATDPQAPTNAVGAQTNIRAGTPHIKRLLSAEEYADLVRKRLKRA